MKTASESPKSDDGDHEGIHAYDQMAVEIAKFLQAHEDVRISLARHRGTGGWFVLVSSNVGLGQLQSDLPRTTTTEQMAEHIGLLYGRLGKASKEAGREVKRKIEKHKEAVVASSDWENW